VIGACDSEVAIGDSYKVEIRAVAEKEIRAVDSARSLGAMMIRTATVELQLLAED
jgi:hypothetical protein